MKIGITSQNFKTITGHAGKTRRFLVYSESGGLWTESERIYLPKEMSMHEFRGDKHPIDDFDVLITASCGGGFKQKMMSRGVKVITTSEVDPLQALDYLSSGTPLPAPLPHSHSHSHSHS